MPRRTGLGCRRTSTAVRRAGTSTTSCAWAWKFAFYEACVAIRKRRWLGLEIPVDREGWDALARAAATDDRLEEKELIEALHIAAEEALTSHQRSVFVALNEVPVDVLAERLGTTRGALYKRLHDSRNRLRAALAAQGLGPDALD